VVGFASMALLATSCTSTSEDHDTTTAQSGSSKGSADAIVPEAKSYTYEQKDAFTNDMRVLLDKMKLEYDQLSARIDKASDAAKAEAKPKLQALQDQITNLKLQLDKVPSATQATWEETKTGFDKGFNDLKAGFNSSRQWVADKLAP